MRSGAVVVRLSSLFVLYFVFFYFVVSEGSIEEYGEYTAVNQNSIQIEVFKSLVNTLQ